MADSLIVDEVRWWHDRCGRFLLDALRYQGSDAGMLAYREEVVEHVSSIPHVVLFWPWASSYVKGSVGHGFPSYFERAGAACVASLVRGAPWDPSDAQLIDFHDTFGSNNPWVWFDLSHQVDGASSAGESGRGA